MTIHLSADYIMEGPEPELSIEYIDEKTDIKTVKTFAGSEAERLYDVLTSPDMTVGGFDADSFLKKRNRKNGHSNSKAMDNLLQTSVNV